MFVLSFKNGDNDPIRNHFDRYYMSIVVIKHFIALINNKPFYDQPIKNKQEAFEKLIETSRNHDYKTWNVLDYLHHQNYYKLICIDLSKQTNKNIPQEIDFTEKLEEDDGAKMLFIAEKQAKNNSKFFFRFINCNNINNGTSKNIKLIEWSKEYQIFDEKMEHC